MILNLYILGVLKERRLGICVEKKRKLNVQTNEGEQDSDHAVLTSAPFVIEIAVYKSLLEGEDEDASYHMKQSRIEIIGKYIQPSFNISRVQQKIALYSSSFSSLRDSSVALEILLIREQWPLFLNMSTYRYT